MEWAEAEAEAGSSTCLNDLNPLNKKHSIQKMEKNIFYNSPLFEGTVHTLDPEDFERALQLYEKGHFLDALGYLMNFIKKGSVKKIGDPFNLKIPHGSMIIEIEANHEKVHLKAPFLKIPEGGSGIALLRQATEINFGELCLIQLQLNQDELHFVYETPLSWSHPRKIYALLQELTGASDHYDDIFIEEFRASRLSENPQTPRKERSIKKAWDLFQDLLQEGKELLNLIEEKRIEIELYLLPLVFIRVEFMVNPHGRLRSDLRKSLWFAYDQNMAYNERLQRVKATFQKLQEMSKEAFREAMMDAEFFIPEKPAVSLERVQTILRENLERDRDALSQGYYLESTIVLTWRFYDLLTSFTLPKKVQKILLKGLKKTSQTSWEKASKILFDYLNQIFTV